MTEKITLIIPIRLTGATYEGETRLARICETVPQDRFEILISDYGTPVEHRAPLDAAVAGGARLVSHPSPQPLFSIGKARDFGVQMSGSPVIMFNDIDFFGTEDMYRRIHAEAMRRRMAENPFDFFCVPVLFLTGEGTKEWLEASEDAKPFQGDLRVEAFEADARRIQSVAYGSSAMVVNRHHYLAVGGHDPRFTGHGAEDYDLLHRLATLAPRGPRPHDYFTDYKDNNVRSYWGFRPFFSLYGLDVLPRGLHLVHLWHPRRMEKGYFRPARNFRLLKKVMKRFDRTGRQPMPLAALAGGTGHWAVLYRGEGGIGLLRQLLPLSAGYHAIRARTVSRAASLMRDMDRSDITHVLVAPDIDGDPSSLMPMLGPSARILLLGQAGPDGSVSLRAADGHAVGSGQIGHARTPAGNVAMIYWKEASIAGFARFGSGRIPDRQEPDSPLFASFGGRQILVRDRSKRPGRKKKSPVLVRLRRWLSGY